MVLYLSLLCRCVLQAVLWSYIGTPMCLLAAEPRSTAGLLFLCQYLCGTILGTPYSMVWDLRVSREGPMPFICLATCSIFLFYCFAFFFFYYTSWYCGVWVLGLIGCESLSPSLALQIFLNNNNNNNSYKWRYSMVGAEPPIEGTHSIVSNSMDTFPSS